MGLTALFPTTFSVVIFVSYMGLFINQGLLITASKNAQNGYNYNMTTVVLLTELLKMLLAIGLFVRSHSFKRYFEEAKKHRRMLLFYTVPAFLYCLYNNLTFVNLSNYDPTSYFLLLQLRVVVTGVVFQILFRKRLSRMQWISLFILTTGCVVKEWGNGHKSKPAPLPQPLVTGASGLHEVGVREIEAEIGQRRFKRIDEGDIPAPIQRLAQPEDGGPAPHQQNGIVAMAALDTPDNVGTKQQQKQLAKVEAALDTADGSVWSMSDLLSSMSGDRSSLLNVFFILILVQVFCSCFAGVYNEYLLKSLGSDMDVQLQNSFMYLNSIIFNVFVLAATGQLGNAVSSENVAAIFSIRVFPIVLNNALIGIVTSLFLKTLDSIVKVFASALELIFTALLSWLFFGFAIDGYTVIAIGFVSLAIYLYAKNPVQSPQPATLPVVVAKDSNQQ
ncbi:UDP-galactose transporter [Capsaspora owczarzaki ATCC 30864]|uniref:UDP-galactose transporter n=1 Tax=Capsaspora owczarzaki (strain ATCC 30864) TaxID=595528 RepID=A0A0D2WHB6_CAPO3|nr:UDP-galactose transporter [Capsaspora owczarzaki ATCC 30864]KJE88990.1 UDP-galactose transporter [Capsaspora owczarzaki ATCC 30864]|eukprot:XP_004365425.1 UDP-galactose transporter [Capsaspora owczarzaki ATCC 30864]